MATGNAQLVRSSFEAFLRGDWAQLSEVVDAGPQWPCYEPGDWDCHDRRKVLATLFERRREAVMTALDAVIAVDERVSAGADANAAAVERTARPPSTAAGASSPPGCAKGQPVRCRRVRAA